MKPFRRVTLSFLAEELSLGVDEVESLLVSLILDDKLSAHIDQLQGIVVMNSTSLSVEDSKYNALTKWTRALENVNTYLENKLQ